MFSLMTVSASISENDKPRIEPATIEDLDELTKLVMELFSISGDFEPNKAAQERGIQLILEQPNRGRIFVLRNQHRIFGMVNVLFTISTACGSMVIIMEDVVVHPDHRRLGYATMLVQHVIEFAKQKHFKRITLLTDQISQESQKLFEKNGFKFTSMIPMRIVL